MAPTAPRSSDPRATASDADHRLTVELAEEAGQMLLALREELSGSAPSVLKREGDRRSHELLMARLAAGAPEDGVLSEEGRDSTERLSTLRTWIVDPLDGTREYGEVPRSDWAVHVALVSGGRPIAGAVALPAQGVTLSTADPSPAPGSVPEVPRVIVSRSRPPRIALAVAESLGAELVELGSAGAKVGAVVLGRAEVYAHAGGQYEWDSCAPVAVASAAGLHTSRIDGSPLVYNAPDPWLPDLLVCHPGLADRVLAVTRR